MTFLYCSMPCGYSSSFFFFFNDTATTEIYTLSLHDALPISCRMPPSSTRPTARPGWKTASRPSSRSEEHTSELQSRPHLVCRLLLEKKKLSNRYSFSAIRARHAITSAYRYLPIDLLNPVNL